MPKLPLIFKMATAERREARRRKLLQNSENRLNRILGSRSSHSNTSQPQIEEDESVSQSSFAENHGVFTEREVVDSDLNGSERADKVLPLKDQSTEMEPSKNVFESKELEAERSTGTEIKHSPSATRDFTEVPKVSLARDTEQRDEASSSRTASDSWRVILNVILAFILVNHWTYVNLEVLFSFSGEEGTGHSPKRLVQSQSLIWPFLALQLLFVCNTRFRQTSHSPFISMLTVALQLCGIPLQITHKINFILTALLAALKDFIVFLFSSVVFHHVVEYGINSGLLEQALENFK